MSHFTQIKKKTGLIWSNSSSEMEIFRLLNYVTKVKDSSWKKIQKKFINQIITYDEGNKVTQKLFKKLHIN